MVWRFIVWVWWVGEFVGFDVLVAGFRGSGVLWVRFGCGWVLVGLVVVGFDFLYLGMF